MTCGEDHDITEFFKTARPLPVAPPKTQLPEKGPSLLDRLRGRTKKQAAEPEDDIDKELALLKQKLQDKNRT